MACTVLLLAQDSKKVVYDLTTSSLETIEKTLIKGIVTHKTHYENQLQELDVIVVIHGGAYKFFLKDVRQTTFQKDEEAKKITPDLAKRLASLHETYGVEFWMCQAGATKYKLTRQDILDFVKLIPNSAIGLIDAQNDGYAYLPLSK